MRAHLLAGPVSVRSIHHHRCRPVVASSWRGPAEAIGSEQNHYDVLGLAPSKSNELIGFLLYHPDVSKDLPERSSRVSAEPMKYFRMNLLDFSMIRHFEFTGALADNTGADRVMVPKIMTGVRIYKWAILRRKMQEKKYWVEFNANRNESFSYYETDYVAEVENTGEQRESFTKVLRSAFLMIFLMQTLGCWLSLTLSSLMAFLDKKLDAGYKISYLIAWILGGRGGILLTLCLSFASWVCGKTSSSVVVLVVVAMWVSSNLARYAPLPQGAF